MINNVIESDKAKIIWSNPNPNASLAAQQIDLSNIAWSFALVVFKEGCQPFPILRNQNINNIDIWYSTPYSNGTTWQTGWAHRRVNMSNNILSLSEGRFTKEDAYNHEVDNACLVPQYIIALD